MNLYSSGKYEKLTADPHPYVGLSGVRYNAAAAQGLDVVYTPRRDWKYGRVVSNPVNPILRRVRHGDLPLGQCAQELARFEDTGRYPDIPELTRLIATYAMHPKHPCIRHARLVLERLTRLEMNS